MVANGFSCRLCGERDVEPVLSLGDLPLVNALVEPTDPRPESRYPLEAVRCPRCTLVQITHTVQPETLFREYTYFSSYSDTFLEHARQFAADSLRHLDPGALVVEAASNDGYLLQWFAPSGIRTLGVEPASNVAAVAQERGIETIPEFLDDELAQRIVAEHGNASLVVANNVLAHVPDLHSFVSALRTLAGDRGVVSIEVPYLCDLVDGLEFDTIYHEHVSYFTATSLRAALECHGLTLTAVERLPVHGGSLRVRAVADGLPDESVAHLLARELEWGVQGPERFERFGQAVYALRGELHELIVELVEAGSTVAAYGAAAKGVVLANTCGLHAGLVDFVADRSPHKQGKMLPGVRIPIYPSAALEREQPDYCLLFAWNIADEILAQQAGYRARGGRFVVPVPEPRIIVR